MTKGCEYTKGSRTLFLSVTLVAARSTQKHTSIMKKITLFLFAFMAAMTMNAQNNPTELPDDFTIIENQPEGQLRTYTRSGGLIREVEKDYFDDDNPYTIKEYTQDGSINIVFAADNKVYIQQPNSWAVLYDGWVEGTLSEDGKTITVALGQYTAYARSFNLATQLWLFNYDESIDSYVRDEETTEISYTIDDEGIIRLQGTSRNHILGLCQRAFGADFQYLDYEWLQDGDFESVYTPVTENVVELPEGVEAQEYYFRGIENDGVGLNDINQTVRLAFDGDDVYLSGFNTILPNAWIKGYRDGDNLVFPTDQLLGSYTTLVYFKNARIVNDQPVAYDMVLTYNGRDAWSSPDYLFISMDRNNFSGISYFSGIYISSTPDEAVTPPEGLMTESYQATFGSLFDVNEGVVNEESIMKIGVQEDKVFIQGFWSKMSQAWIQATLSDGALVIPTPQYLGEVEVQDVGDFPVFLTAYDTSSGTLLPELKFIEDAATNTFSGQSAGISFGVNKAFYMTLENIYDLTFTRTTEPVGLNDELRMTDDGLRMMDEGIYDLQGRLAHRGYEGTKKGVYIVRMSDGTVRKVRF